MGSGERRVRARGGLLIFGYLFLQAFLERTWSCEILSLLFQAVLLSLPPRTLSKKRGERGARQDCLKNNADLALALAFRLLRLRLALKSQLRQPTHTNQRTSTVSANGISKRSGAALYHTRLVPHECQRLARIKASRQQHSQDEPVLPSPHLVLDSAYAHLFLIRPPPKLTFARHSLQPSPRRRPRLTDHREPQAWIGSRQLPPLSAPSYSARSTTRRLSSDRDPPVRHRPYRCTSSRPRVDQGFVERSFSLLVSS